MIGLGWNRTRRDLRRSRTAGRLRVTDQTSMSDSPQLRAPGTPSRPLRDRKTGSCGSLLFEGHQFHGLLRDVLGAYFQLFNQLPRRARVAKTVLHAYGAGDQRQAVELPAFGEKRADAPGQRADLMLFRSDHDAGLPRGAHHGFSVDGLERRSEE